MTKCDGCSLSILRDILQSTLIDWRLVFRIFPLSSIPVVDPIDEHVEVYIFFIPIIQLTAKHLLFTSNRNGSVCLIDIVKDDFFYQLLLARILNKGSIDILTILLLLQRGGLHIQGTLTIVFYINR